MLDKHGGTLRRSLSCNFIALDTGLFRNPVRFSTSDFFAEAVVYSKIGPIIRVKNLTGLMIIS